jgi:cardiolipin synthase
MSLSAWRRAAAILLGAAALVALGLVLAQDQVTLRVRSAVQPDDPRHPEYVASLIGQSVTRGDAYTVLTNGDEIFPAMLRTIDAARRRISFESYIYESGAVADRFTSAFERAARRGVRVQIVVDSVGASGMDAAIVERLRAAGCHVARFNTPRWYSLEEINYRTHRKILVVDGEVAFTGGIGIADHWLGRAQDEEHWRDTQVEIRGPIVRLIEGAFYENFIEADGRDAPQLDPAPDSTGSDGASIVVRSSPTGGSNDLERLYLLTVAGARRTLDIATPYFVTDESTDRALAEAVARGVRIRFLVEGNITDAMPVKYASRAAYDRLLERGIEIYEYQPTMMHTKVMVADGVWSLFGSANFDNRSLELNDELNVAVASRELAARFLEDFERDLKVSHRLTLGAWRERPPLDKAREQFWSAFGEIF